jgi:N-acetylglucosaminyldiphosphoundecaprenol N-acetyl-beta-D-mannosaminyltransferase
LPPKQKTGTPLQQLPKINILNTTIHNLSMKETLALVSQAISENKQLHHVVVNAGKIVAMQKDEALRKSVNESDIINADGQAVVWAAKILGKPLKERVAGIDLMENLVELAHQQNHKIFLLGAKEEVVRKVSEIYQEKYNTKLIVGYRNGYFTREDEPQIAQQIANSGAQMLFVAITSPIKENFLYNHRELLKNVPFVMGVGGSFDVVSGLTKRAPVWMQNAGLEWFYRFLQEPKRMWKRYLVGNSTFIWLVLKEKFSSK